LGHSESAEQMVLVMKIGRKDAERARRLAESATSEELRRELFRIAA